MESLHLSICHLVDNVSSGPIVSCHYCVFLGNNLLSWSTKRQPTFSRSSAVAEYRGVANVVAETFWFRNHLRELHTPLSSATLVYCDNGIDTAYLLLYMDDIVLTASLEGLLQRIIGSLHQEFTMTDLGPLNYFLGISVTRDFSGLFLSQKKYDIKILEKAHMVSCNTSRTPVDTESKLGVDGDPVSDLTLYRSLADPREPRLSALKRILWHIQGTLNYGLQLFSSSTTDLIAYFDVDWAGCPTTRRSILGYCVFLGNNLLSWSTKRQPTFSRSSAVAEYRGVANVVAETFWFRNHLRELHT
nr:ribonuclease H-like domain-containing protein [Tanacetum cinerariifolium]